MVEIANSAMVRRASAEDATGPRARAASPDGDALVLLTTLAVSQWRTLAERAVEPNGYYLPDWELAVNAFASGRTGASALIAQNDAAQDGAARLIGLMPVVAMSRAYKIPLPALASAHPYGTLCTPLLDRDAAPAAAAQLMRAARKAGAHALILREISLDGAAM
ncbi:MAG TPA: GNAT family N-acetyltransferase, partial [Bradyrhizobium sp.]